MGKGRVNRHSDLCLELNNLYQEKNLKYGNSFEITYLEYGKAALLLRLDDKLSRAKMLLRNPGTDPGDESIRDTLIDLANYALMGIMSIEGDTNEEEEL